MIIILIICIGAIVLLAVIFRDQEQGIYQDILLNKRRTKMDNQHKKITGYRDTIQPILCKQGHRHESRMRVAKPQNSRTAISARVI